MSEWYYAEGQQRQGPVPDTEIRQLFQRSQITLDTLVWREGMGQWAELRSVVDELQLQSLAAVAAEPATGFDLRGDYAAIDNGTAPLPGTGPLSASPYSAPASDVGFPGAMPVHGAEVVYAGFWKRLAAYLIDYVILTASSMAIGAIVGLGIGGAASLAGGGSTTAGVMSQVIGALIGFGISLAYYAWFHASSGGATPGKMAIGIKVVRSDGDRITMARSIGRYFATLLSSLTLLIGYLLAAFTERKQALHDMICDTVVVDKWAFTDQPQRQRHELGAVTIVILILGGILTAGVMVAMVVAIGAIAKMAG
ncbi:RDD family protein [Stenotrophomonas sp. CFBP 13718]|uniref:RDD family protein n=1 Tax=Stenotrophomonas sp. CFBP 13718 TaxID=2775304 RepID=UPI0017862EF4|nr:RDD family protein [Stenotrophomonas sp. CFBP 13718]MBD8695854.1 RDD family protein [Stenotrophomonas sp. CFBP 13718]